METRQEPQLSHYAPGPPILREPLKVDPKYPLLSSVPPADELNRSPLPNNAVENGMARKSSRRRRTSGSASNEKAQLESFPQPPAPEVPRAPPVSYRDPYVNGHTSSSRDSSSTSFAARARALPGDVDFIPTNIPRNDVGPHDRTSADHVTGHKRRGSVNHSSGVDFSANPAVGTSFESPSTGQTVQQQSPSIATQRQTQNPNPNSPSQVTLRNVSGKYKDAQSAPSRSNTNRSTAGVVEPRSEYAVDRSPLQNLEAKFHDISKEEKRARVEEAEQRLKESLSNGGRRRVSAEVDPSPKRTSSRHVSADTGSRSRRVSSGQHREAQGGPIFQEAGKITDNLPTKRDRIIDSNNTSSQWPVDSLQRGLYQEAEYQETPIKADQNGTRDRVRNTSGRAPDVAGLDPQPGRGVRFEGSKSINSPDDILDSRPDQRIKRSDRPDQRAAGSRLDGPTLTRETQQAQKGGYSEEQPVMGNQSSKQVPTQQQHLFNERSQPFQNGRSTADYGGAPDLLPKNAVSGYSQASKYQIPPQTAARVGNRQKVGFGSNQRDTVETPGHHRHHLSDILHHGDKNTVEQSRNIEAEPRHLDEWRQGGTARLTTADYDAPDSATTKQSAWWEGGRSGSQRTSTAARKDFGIGSQSTDKNYREDYGMNQFPFSNVELQSSDPTELSPRVFDESRVRPYVGEVLLRGNAHKHLWPKNPIPFRLPRSGGNPNLSLTSAYSYSCSYLSEHDIYHPDHICKPYMSKELIRSMRSIRVRAVPKTAAFDPPLYLKCGPLLRYTGLKRDRQQNTSTRNTSSSTEREFWRGSVMIVTLDAESTYHPAPTLRLYPEPMDLLPPPPERVDGDSGYDLLTEYIDPIAGLPKLSRTGKTIYVKPVEDLEQEVDLSRVEDDTGLYEETRTAAVPTSYGTPDFRPGRGNAQKPANSNDRRSVSRTAMKGQEISGVRLHAELGCTFWRFNLEIELVPHQARIAYRINNSASVGFWVPAKGQSMNVMFHSCNGFSMSVKYAKIIDHTSNIRLTCPLVQLISRVPTLCGVMCSTVIKHDHSTQ